MRAFESLLGDGHSGMSIGFTKNILNRLIDGKPLTPIEDTEEVWGEPRIDSRDKSKQYQCKRMSSLFKRVAQNGSVTYSDINRYYCTNEEKVELVDREEEMEIKRLKNAKFGTKELHVVVTGWAFYVKGKGYVAYSSNRDKYGILAPYIPCGGKRALQAILNAGGFTSFEGMEYVKELGA